MATGPKAIRPAPWHTMPPKAGRSRVQEVDRDRLRFAYRTQTDDGNPTYVDWTVEISPDGGGARVDVRWEACLRPRAAPQGAARRQLPVPAPGLHARGPHGDPIRRSRRDHRARRCVLHAGGTSARRGCRVR